MSPTLNKKHQWNDLPAAEIVEGKVRIYAYRVEELGVYLLSENPEGIEDYIVVQASPTNVENGKLSMLVLSSSFCEHDALCDNDALCDTGRGR